MRLIIGMTFRTQCGHYSKTICRDAKAHGAVTPATIGYSSTPVSAGRITGVWILCTGAPYAICPRITAAEEICTTDFVAGVTRACGKNDLSCWSKSLDFEWLMIDASHVKVHPDAAGAVGGNQDMERTKGGSIPKSTWPRMRDVSIRLRWAVKRYASRRGL
jgi:hypothetical protein